MALDIIGSFARGFRAGDEIGSRWSERKFNRQVADIEKRYVAGEIDDDGLDAELANAYQTSGAAKRGIGMDGSMVGGQAERLRERMNASGRRASAGALATAQNGAETAAAYTPLRDTMVRSGDVEAVAKLRRLQDTAGAYEEDASGTPILARQTAARARTEAMQGDTAAAAQSGSETENFRREMFNLNAGRLMQLKDNAFSTGEDGKIVVNDAVMEQVEVFAQNAAMSVFPNVGRVQYNPGGEGTLPELADTFTVFDKEGNAIDGFPATKAFEYLSQFAEDPSKLMEATLNQYRANAAGEAANEAELRKMAAKELFSTVGKLFGGGPEGETKAAAIATAGIDAAKLDVKFETDAATEDGSIPITIDGKVFLFQPAPEGDSGVKGGLPFIIRDEQGRPVNQSELEAAKLQAATKLASAVNTANAGLDIEQRVALARAAIDVFSGLVPGGSGAPPRGEAPASTSRGALDGVRGNQRGAEAGSGYQPFPQDFDSIVEMVVETEGGFVADDAGAGATNEGINSRANPDIDVRNMTPETRNRVYRERYWDAIGADDLPPKLRAVAFDAAVNQGPALAKRWIEESGGDPQAYLDLRAAHYQSLIEKNPGKFRQYAAGWAKRLDDLANVLESAPDDRAGHMADTAFDDQLMPRGGAGGTPRAAARPAPPASAAGRAGTAARENFDRGIGALGAVRNAAVRNAAVGINALQTPSRLSAEAAVDFLRGFKR